VGRIDVLQDTPPGGPQFLDAIRVAFAGMQRLFLRGSFSLFSAADMLEGLMRTCCFWSRRSHSSVSFASGCSWTKALICWSWGSWSWLAKPPRRGLAVYEPVSRRRWKSFRIQAVLTQKRLATSVRMLPG
jgi:hypothetical protein